MDTQQHRDAWSTVASTARSGSIGYTSVSATDAAELTQAVRDWNFEFMQLSSGTFRANGAMLQLDGVSIARVSMSRTLLQKGFATCGTFAVFIPGAGSGPVFANGQLVETGQCATLAEGAQLEAISHEGYMDVCFGLDLDRLSPTTGGVERRLTRPRAGRFHRGTRSCLDQLKSWIASTGSWRPSRSTRNAWATIACERVSRTRPWLRCCGSTILLRMWMQLRMVRAPADEPLCGSRANSFIRDCPSRCGYPTCAATRICRSGLSSMAFGRSRV